MFSCDNCQFMRVTVDFPVTVQTDSVPAEMLIARAFRISTDAICIWSVRPLPINVPFVLHFPLEWQRAFAIVRVVGQNGYCYTCQFIDLPPWVYASLDKAVHTYLMEASPRTLRTLWGGPEESIVENN